jgi:hypothetical protein
MKVFLVMIASCFLLTVSAFAYEFGPDSDKITNPYINMQSGNWSFQQGVGSIWNGRVIYMMAVGKELVSGAKIGTQTYNNVKCQKIHFVMTDDGGDNENEFFIMSFAQDVEGNVWVMKIYAPAHDMTAFLGGDNWKSMLMPATPTVGNSAGLKMPEDNENYCEVAQVGIQSITTNFGTYSDCIKVECYDEDPNKTEVDYYCKNVGSVRSYDAIDPSNVADLKDFGNEKMNDKVVVIPLFD